MLKNVRHISEGNFYGLHVTNKADSVILDKKLKTLEACKDAQSHCYRKEEKDLVNTLARLQKSKEQYHHNDELIMRHIGERFLRGNIEEPSHVNDKKQHKGSSHGLPPPTPKTSAHDVTKILAAHPPQNHKEHIIGSKIHRTTGFTDCVICRLPRGSHASGNDVCRCEKGPDKGTHHMHPAALHEDKARPEYLHSKERKQLFDKLHCTKPPTPFLDKLSNEMQQVIENPPTTYREDATSPHRRKDHPHDEMTSPQRQETKHHQYKDYEGPSSHRRRASLDNGRSHNDQVMPAASVRRASLDNEKVHYPNKDYGVSGTHARRSSLDNDKVHSPYKNYGVPSTHARRSSFDNENIHTPNKDYELPSAPARRTSHENGKAHHERYGYPRRMSSHDNNQTHHPNKEHDVGSLPFRKTSHENGKRYEYEGRSYSGRQLSLQKSFEDHRGMNYHDRQFRYRKDSIIEDGEYIVLPKQKRMTNEFGSHHRNMDSYYSLGELRSRSSTAENTEVRRKIFKTTNSALYTMNPSDQAFERHGFYSPTYGSQHTTLPQHSGRSSEAFHSLIHPDNLMKYNHHHDSHESPRTKGHHHGDIQRHKEGHSKHHFHGYYIHKYDHTGTRQIAHIPIGANSHIAEMLERQHEPKSNHLSLLSNLRHLLSVYQRLDATLPRYPWPSPLHTEMTKEEFEKLKDCRYLRLPKNMMDSRMESPIFQ